MRNGSGHDKAADVRASVVQQEYSVGRTYPLWKIQQRQDTMTLHCTAPRFSMEEQPRDLGQVQAADFRMKMQGLIVWMALAIQVQPRTCLGGVVSQHRDKHLIRTLMQRVRNCALWRRLLFRVDGCLAYINVIRKAFREPIPG